MIRAIRCWLLSVGVLMMGVQAGVAQSPTLLSTMLPAPNPPLPTPPPPPSSLPVLPTTSMMPATASPFSFSSLEDRNDSILVGNSLLDGTRNNLGWFVNADVDALGPHVHNQLTAGVAVGPVTDQVSLPSANLHWTVAPRIEVGYRPGEAIGEFLVSFRFFATSGSASTPGFDAAGDPGLLHSRFSMNVIDLDYANQEPSLQPWFDMKWRVGVRLANLYFDSEETSPLLQQHVTNDYFGAGPHAALELWRPVAESRFGLFCKTDLGCVVGTVRQGFAETLPGPMSGFTRQSQTMPSVMLDVQAGIGWTPTDTWRFSAGYSYEHWWDATFAGASRGDVGTQGVFVRGEWKF